MHINTKEVLYSAKNRTKKICFKPFVIPLLEIQPSDSISLLKILFGL